MLIINYFLDLNDILNKRFFSDLKLFNNIKKEPGGFNE